MARYSRYWTGNVTHQHAEYNYAALYDDAVPTDGDTTALGEIAGFRDEAVAARAAACLNALEGIPDPAAFVEAATGWKATLEKIAQHEESTYGYFHGGDPRKFCPDGESNTDDERKAHEEACRAFDDADAKGEPLPPMRCASGALPCGVHLLKSQFGLGVYSYPSRCALVAQDALSNTGKAVG